MVNHHPQPPMDRVPRIFRESVAALWKCCDQFYCWCHIQRRIPDCEWTRISRKRRIEFYVVTENGKWIYGFGDTEEIDADRPLTMDELKSYPDLKNVVIRKINVFENWAKRDVVAKLRPLDVDMEVLMNFVLFLSNEPFLHVGYTSPESLDSPEESTLLNFLQEMQFSHVYFSCYEAKYNQLLERQYSRRKATRIEVFKIKSGKEFLEAEVAALRIRKCKISYFLSPNLLDAIVSRFLVDPGQFGEDYEVSCFFKLKKAKEILREMKKTTRFVREYANQKTGDNEFAVEGSNGKFLTIRKNVGTWTLSV